MSVPNFVSIYVQHIFELLSNKFHFQKNATYTFSEQVIKY